jgi:carboxyl-terminal processing protease
MRTWAPKWPHMAGSRSKIALIAILSVLAGAAGIQPFAIGHEGVQSGAPNSLPIAREEKLNVFEKLWEVVDKQYFDSRFNGADWAAVKERYRPQVEAAKDKMVLRGLLQRMLDELHTSHLKVEFHARLSADRVRHDIDRKVDRKDLMFFDPGLNLKLIEGRWVVDSIKEGSGAQLAGVERGWTLTRWNGESFSASTEVVYDLGDEVMLSFADAQGQERSLRIECKLYVLPHAAPVRVSRALEEGTVYLRFDEFSPGTDDWFSDQVFRNRQAPAIIIDLRGNPGGRISVLRKCFEPFFSGPATFGEYRERNGKEPLLKVSGKGKDAFSGKLVVLIDGMSSSAAEIFAAGIQESGRGTLIGRQSRGEVLKAVYVGLSSGFKLQVPIQDYRTAKGIRLEGRGVTPDLAVTYTLQDFLQNRDPDLEAAKVAQPVRLR